MTNGCPRWTKFVTHSHSKRVGRSPLARQLFGAVFGRTLPDSRAHCGRSSGEKQSIAPGFLDPPFLHTVLRHRWRTKTLVSRSWIWPDPPWNEELCMCEVWGRRVLWFDFASLVRSGVVSGHRAPSFWCKVRLRAWRVHSHVLATLPHFWHAMPILVLVYCYAFGWTILAHGTACWLNGH